MTAQQGRSKLAALVHADIKGYSGFMESDEEWTIATLTSFKDELKRLVQSHHGRVVDTAGDGFLLEFGSAKDGVQFALEFQNVVRTRNSGQPLHRRMEFRIGIHAGDVTEIEDKIYGHTVNVTARLEEFAEPGGICVSGTVYEMVKGLALECEFLGKQALKNITELLSVYRIHTKSSIRVSEGSTTSEVPAGPGSLPRDIPSAKVRKEFSDKQRAGLLREAFELIIDHFRQESELLEKRAPNIETEVNEISRQKFVFEVYRAGKLKNACKIWIGTFGSQRNISYREGDFAPHDDSSVNEWIYVENDDLQMYLRGLMGEFGSRMDDKLSSEDAARILWERFIRPLSY